MKRTPKPIPMTKVLDTSITIDTPKSVEHLLAKYSFVSDVFRVVKKRERALPFTEHFSVWELGRSATAEEIASALGAKGLRPATGQELLCFADVHPEACSPALVATGSGEHLGGHTGSPVVAIPPNGESRAGEMFVEQFAAGTHLLATPADQGH